MNKKRTQNAWAFYDWANSVYSLCISTAIFPIYYSAVTNPDNIEGSLVNFLGFQIQGSALLSYAISFSFLLVAFSSPFLSGIADYLNRKKFFMQIFVFIGSFACISLYWFDADRLEIGILGAVLASLGFAGSLVFYNAFLPQIAEPDEYDSLSAKGFSMGYIGSVLLLIFLLVLIESFESFGFETKGAATRFSFLIVGMWWLGFSQLSIYFLPKDGKTSFSSSVLFKGFSELKKVWTQLNANPELKSFLAAFFFISTGVQTVIYLAGIYAKETLGFPTAQLIIIILIIQIVAIAGASIFARVSNKIGNTNTLIIQASIWAIICVLAFFVTPNIKWLFYIVAFLVGLVLGGIQSLARASYSKLLPKTNDLASFFSFYELTEKIAIVLGTLTLGIVVSISGSMRNAVLFLSIYFLISVFLLFKLKQIQKN